MPMRVWIIASLFTAVLVSADKTAYKRNTVIDFTGVKVMGEVVRPAITIVHGRTRTKFRPLVQSRGDFRPELVKSLDQI
jgi:hypothetical protein